jgi:hypothetical protein
MKPAQSIQFLAITLIITACNSDPSSSGGPLAEIINPIQIAARVGSTFTYESVNTDQNGEVTKTDGGTIELTNKNASIGGKTGVHEFSAEGAPRWHHIVEADNTMWMHRPAYSSPSGSQSEYWIKLTPRGTFAITTMDTSYTTSGLVQRMVQRLELTGKGSAEIEVDGKSYPGYRVESITTTTSYINGVQYSSSTINTTYLYLPQFALVAYEKHEIPIAGMTLELRMTSIDLR